MKEELCCAICTEELQEPKDLECSHTFCKQCLHKWLNTQNQKTSIPCPICLHVTPLSNDGIDGLKTNHITKNLVVQVRSASIGSALNSACKIHKGMTVTINCKTCDQFVCEKCTIICKRLRHDIEDAAPVGFHNTGNMLHALSSQKHMCMNHFRENQRRQKNWRSQVQQIIHMIKEYSDKLKENIEKDVERKFDELAKMSKEGEDTFSGYEMELKDLMKEVDGAIQKQAQAKQTAAQTTTTAMEPTATAVQPTATAMQVAATQGTPPAALPASHQDLPVLQQALAMPYVGQQSVQHVQSQQILQPNQILQTNQVQSSQMWLHPAGQAGTNIPVQMQSHVFDPVSGTVRPTVHPVHFQGHFGPIQGIGLPLNGQSSHGNASQMPTVPHGPSTINQQETGSHFVSRQQNREISEAQKVANEEMEKVLKKTIPKIPENRMLTFVASGHHLKDYPVGQMIFQSW